MDVYRILQMNIRLNLTVHQQDISISLFVSALLCAFFDLLFQFNERIRFTLLEFSTEVCMSTYSYWKLTAE